MTFQREVVQTPARDDPGGGAVTRRALLKRVGVGAVTVLVAGIGVGSYRFCSNGFSTAATVRRTTRGRTGKRMLALVAWILTGLIHRGRSGPAPERGRSRWSALEAGAASS